MSEIARRVLHRISAPAEFKVVGDTGRFAGYASIWGNVDLGGDVVAPGAFKKIHKNEDDKVVVLWQHGMSDPIGVAAVAQDEKGLRFEGELVLEDIVARKAYAHMKKKSVRGMSIGFDILPGGAEVLESGVRKLNALELWEISVVTFGMNPQAGVDTVKDAMNCRTVRELEHLLRASICITRTKAAKAAAVLWPILAERDAQEDDVSLNERDAHAAGREDRESSKAIEGLIRRELHSLNDLLQRL